MGSGPVFILFVIIAILVIGFVIRMQINSSKKKAEDTGNNELNKHSKEKEYSGSNNVDAFETIRSYAYVHYVAVIRARLEAEGIETFVTNEQTLSTNPILTTAIGGVDLQVRKSQVKRALQIIEEDEEMKGWQAEDEELEDQ